MWSVHTACESVSCTRFSFIFGRNNGNSRFRCFSFCAWGVFHTFYNISSLFDDEFTFPGISLRVRCVSHNLAFIGRCNIVASCCVSDNFIDYVKTWFGLDLAN